MSSNTPFLDLYKKNPETDKQDTFNIKTMMNDNWDKIDEKTGIHEARISTNERSITDLQGRTDEIEKQISSEISGNGVLSNQDPVTSIDSKTAGIVKKVEIEGRMIVNLIKHKIKTTKDYASHVKYLKTISLNMDKNKTYMAVNNADKPIAMDASVDGEYKYFEVPAKSSLVIKGTELINNFYGKTAQGWSDSDAEIFEKFMILEGDWSLRKIPYVQGAQPLLNPSIMISNDNLCPSFDKWNLKGSMKLKNTRSIVNEGGIAGAGANLASVKINVKSDTEYCVYIERNDSDRFLIKLKDENGKELISTNIVNGGKIRTNSETCQLELMWYTVNVAGSDLFLEGVMLSEGDGLLSEFVEHEEAKRIYPTYLASIEDSKDKLVDEAGVVKIERNVGRCIIDENSVQSYTFSAWENSSFDQNSKIVKIKNIDSNAKFTYGNIIKRYDGEICKIDSNVNRINEGAVFNGGEVRIGFSNAETGWGQSYNPGQDEIKAYFLGWKMYEEGSGRDKEYTGEGSAIKRWYRIGRIGEEFSKEHSSESVPMESYYGWNAYELYYALKEAVIEEINPIGDMITTFQGQNTISVESGIAYEKANPIFTGVSHYEINHKDKPESKLKNYPTSSGSFKVYKKKDGITVLDNSWSSIFGGAGYGDIRAQILRENFDSQAEYYVQYEVLHERHDSQVFDVKMQFSGTLHETLESHGVAVSKLGDEIAEIQLEKDRVLIKGSGERVEISDIVEFSSLKNGYKSKTLVFKKAFKKPPMVVPIFQNNIHNSFLNISVESTTPTNCGIMIASSVDQTFQNPLKLKCLIIGE